MTCILKKGTILSVEFNWGVNYNKMEQIEDVKSDYTKVMKDAIVTMSSIIFMINIFLSKDYTAILMNSFTYISSQGLTFYSLNPHSSGGKWRRKIITYSSIYSIPILVLCLIIISKIEVSDLFIFITMWGLKLGLSALSLFIIYASFADNTDTVTDKESKLKSETKKNLQQEYDKQQEESIYSTRNRRTSNNRKTREYIENGKKKKGED